jgi:hypothetical protein
VLSNVKKWKFRANNGRTEVVIYQFRFPEGECGQKTNHLFVFRAPNIVTITACFGGMSWQP